MDSRKLNKKLKKNKYRILTTVILLLLAFLIGSIVKNTIDENAISKYDNEILIIKGDGNQLDSLTLKEIRTLNPDKKDIYLNNGLEKVSIEGVPIEKIIGNLNVNLKDRALILAEDNDGNQRRISMSAALEPERVYLVYKIDDTPVFDINPKYGKMVLLDTNSDSNSSWVNNLKTLDIE